MISQVDTEVMPFPVARALLRLIADTIDRAKVAYDPLVNTFQIVQLVCPVNDSAAGVGYLRQVLDIVFFPELWEVRSQL